MTKKIYFMLFSIFLSIICLSAQVAHNVNVTTAGGLSTAIGNNLKTVTDLTLTGTINATDFQTIKQMTALKNLDMSEVTIVNNTVPVSAFENKVLNDLVLPEGLEVLGNSSFKGSNIISGIILPSTIKNIQSWVFENSNTRVDLSKTKNSLEIIYAGAFNNYKGSETLDFSNFLNTLQFANVGNISVFSNYSGHVILPRNMVNMPDYLFYSFKGTVTLPQGLKSTGERSFANATMPSLELPEGLEIIGHFGFEGARINQPLILPSSLKQIVNWAFKDMKTEVSFSKTKNSLENLGLQLFCNYTGSSELDFSDFTSIKVYNYVGGNGVFSNYSGHIILPRNMVNMPDYLFYSFKGTVTLPQGLKSTGERSFANATMPSLELPEGLEIIGHFGFEGARINQPLILPSSLKQIVNWAFKDMKTEVSFSKTKNSLENLGLQLFCNYTGSSELDFSDFTSIKVYNYVGGNGVFSNYSGHIILPRNMVNMPDYLFYSFKGTVTLPQGLKSTGERSFANATMPSLELPEGLEIIGHFGFEGARINQPLILPSSLKQIVNWAFKDMKTEVSFSKTKNSLENLGLQLFCNYTGSSELDFSDFTSIKVYNYVGGNGVFSNYSGHVILPRNMVNMPDYLFYSFKGAVTLPQGLNSIGNNAFQNSTITSIDLPASVTSIGTNAFNSASQLSKIVSRNTIPPALGSNVFYRVNKETTSLEVPNSSINLYGTAAQWKDFLNILSLSQVEPDPFEKGKESSVYISIPTDGNGIDMQGWDYDNNKMQDGQPIVKTYKTIEIDEYTWLSENLRLKYKWNDWMNLTQADVDNYSNFYLGGKKISLSQFEDIFGTWVSLYPKALSYQSQFTVFSSKGGSTEKGWQLPSSADIWQLYGLAPRKSGNIYKDVQDFLFMSPCENDLDLRKNMMNRDNISGLTLTPLGMRESFYGDEAKIYGFGTLVGLRTNGWTRIEAISDLATSGILPGMRSLDLYHFSQARYIKPKTDKELGYKIYIDTTNDKVLMLPYDQVSTLPELEKGLERGIALRYANRKEKQIVKKWSEIQAEAAEIRNALIAVNVPQPLPACDRPVIEDGPDPYQKGKEGSIHIWISENGADGDGVCFQAYDFDTNQERGINQGFQGTYKTIGVGEYNYTKENLKAIGRSRWGTDYSWFRWNENNINSITKSFSQETPLSVNEFTKIYGSWFSRLPAVFAYANPDHVIFRDKEGGSIQQGWGLPSITDILQMIGQAPSTGDINYDILNFTGASNKDVPANHQANWYNQYNNISELTLTPLGSRHPIEGNLASDVYAFKVLSKLRLKDNGSRATFNFYVSGSFYGAEDDHYSQVRYTRAKSDEELGYKLYIDNCNDQVIMLPYTQESNLIELPKGLERGIALRYANREQMKIYKTWSEICVEADQIRNSLENLPARENFNFPGCNENPDPEIPEEPDPKPESPENPDSEIQIETYPADDIDRIDKISFAYDLAGNRVKKEIILASTRSLVEEDQTFIDDINKFQVTIFPNPTKGLITIAIKDFVSTSITNKLTVFDLNGRVVAQEKIAANTTQIDISAQSRGTYVLVISIDGKSSSWKIIKE